MPRRTSTLLGPDGAPVVHHSAGPGPEADAIRREATVLALARGPGVVDLVATGDGADGGAWLSTRYLAGGTLTDLVRSAGEPAATAALARVASTLADLHERGIVHGRCTAEHVVGGATGASLCGFSGASVVGTGRSPDTLVDRGAFATLVSATLASDAETSRRARRTVASLTSPSSGTNLRAVASELWALSRDAGWVEPGDVAGRPGQRQGHRREAERSARSPFALRRMRLGRIDAATTRSIDSRTTPVQPPLDPRRAAPVWPRSLESAPIGSPDGEAPPTPRVSSGEPAPWEPDAHGAEPVDERALCDGADGSPPLARPRGGAGMDRTPLARRPLRSQPRHRQPRDGRHATAPTRPGTGGRWRLAIAGAASAASVAVLAGILLHGDRGPHPSQAATAAPSARPAPGRAPAVSSTSVPPSRTAERSPAPARVWPRPTEAGSEGAPEPEPPRAATHPPVGGLAAPVVEHAGARYAVGLPGDLVLLGDWDCDGVATPAVVRPGDGTIWSFASWTTGPQLVAAELIAQAPAPVGAITRSGTDGCDVLAITTANGNELIVDPGTIQRQSGR